GFDPAARRGAWEMVRGLKSLGKTVLLTTHYMEEAEYLADRVAIMVQGRIVALGAPGELSLEGRTTTVRFRLPEGSAGLPDALQAVALDGGAYSLETDSPTGTLHALTSWAVEHGVELEELSVTHPTLEDLFIELVGDDGESGGQA
ncbi:MAG: ABC transporter ATP-binding protein, partial [Chloroflexota bacterium]|nr:ABC transporter ATP-binding protein [Chloroflexota bacterium]